MSDLCALCDDPMNPGAQRETLADGRKIHATCAESVAALQEPADLHRTLLEIEKIAEAQVRAKVAELVPGYLDTEVIEQVAAAVEAATIEVILPTKSVQLRRLMENAAEGLERQVEYERKLKSYSQTLTPGQVVDMVKASTVLRTVAIYVSEDVS